jgi:hypothetical protein
MDTKDPVSLFLTRDNFLDSLLDEDDRWSPAAVRRTLQTSEAFDALFLGIVTYLTEHGHLDSAERPEIRSNVSGQLPLMIGKTFHLNISKLVKKDIKEFAGSFTVLLSLALKQYPVALAALVPVITNMSTKLEKRLGEVCVVESIQEHYQRKTKRGATAEEIAHELKDEPCRYPGQGCRYEETRVCKIRSESVGLVLESLKTREVVAPLTHEQPFEWRVRF